MNRFIRSLLVLVCLFISKDALASSSNEEPTQRIVSVSFQSPHNIWYAGVGDYAHYFLVKQWNENQFQLPSGFPRQTSPDYEPGEAILAVSQDVWAIGAGPSDKQPLQIYHLVGASWNSVPGPVFHAEEIHALAALNTNDVWAVGDYYPLENGESAIKTFIMHWEGKVLRRVASPNVGGANNILLSVSALSKNDVWAVGSTNGFNGGSRPLIEHYDGHSWDIVTSPMVSSYGLNSVSALSKNDVWAVGNYNQGCHSTVCSSSAFAEHYDGHSWQVVFRSAVGSFSSVSALSKNDVWAVGNTIEHYDGHSWQNIASLQVFTDSTFVGVQAFSKESVWVVGESLFQAKMFLEAWDGHRWQIVYLSKIS